MALNFQHKQLANGLNVVVENNPSAHTAAVGFFVKAGTRDEEKNVMGVSHFLEHMMFKGTHRRTADDVNREFDEMGANYNAYTSQENTVYFAQVLPEYLPDAVDLLGDMLRPALREDDFDMEKKVIIEEIGMYDDRPFWRLHDALMEHHYGDHSLSYRVLGTVDSIEALQAAQMRDYFNQRYAPDCITVSAAGKIDFDHFVDLIEKATGHWQPTDAKRIYKDTTVKTSDHLMVDETVSRHYMAMLCAAPSSQDERRFTASVLADVLGDDDGSRLYWALVDPGICDEADLSFQPQDQTGCYFASASCDPDRAEQVEQIMLTTLDDYVNDIDDDEIQRAKNKIATQATLSGESTGGRMRALGGMWTYLGRYIPLEEEIQAIMAVTPQDIKDLATDMPFSPRTIVRLGPQKK